MKYLHNCINEQNHLGAFKLGKLDEKKARSLDDFWNCCKGIQCILHKTKKISVKDIFP